MDKKDAFREFIRSKPYLVTKVKIKKHLGKNYMKYTTFMEKMKMPGISLKMKIGQHL